jgi:hypothetical protein
MQENPSRQKAPNSGAAAKKKRATPFVVRASARFPLSLSLMRANQATTTPPLWVALNPLIWILWILDFLIWFLNPFAWFHFVSFVSAFRPSQKT